MLNQNQTMSKGLKKQDEMIMRLLRRMLMILVMMVSRMRPEVILKVFSSLEIKGILGIEQEVNSNKEETFVILEDMMI